jgi:hypothetical protein
MSENPSLMHDKPRIRGVIALFWLAATLLALGASPYWRISPDAALYTGIARSVATGEGYTFSGDPQTSIPPVTPLYLAAAYKIAHVASPSLSFLNTFAYFNGFMAIAGMAGLLAGFFLMVELAGLKRAVFALVFLVTSRQYMLHSIQPLTDVSYAAVSWAALFFLLRFERRDGWGNAALACVLLPVAPLTRLVGLSLVLAVAVYYLARVVRAKSEARGRAAVGLASVVPAAVVCAWMLYAILASRSGPAFNYWNDLAAHRTVGEIFARIGHDLWTIPGSIFEAVVGMQSVYGLGAILTAVVLLGAWQFWKRGARLAVGVFVLYFLYVAAGEEALPRYVIPMLPFVYLFMIEGFAALIAWIRDGWGSPFAALAAKRLLIFLAASLVFINVFYDAREIALNFSPSFYASYRHGRWVDYLDLSDALAKSPPAGRVMMYHPREVTALSGLSTAWLPYNPETTYRPTAAETARYVRDSRVSTIVIDPDDAGSAEFLGAFVDNGPLRWRESARVGRLSLYTLEDGSGGSERVLK